jgi:hypothetical protein
VTLIVNLLQSNSWWQKTVESLIHYDATSTHYEQFCGCIRGSLRQTNHKLRTVTSVITMFKSLWLLYVGPIGRKKHVKNPHSLEELQENIWHEICTIPNSSFAFLETYFQDVRHLYNQSHFEPSMKYHNFNCSKKPGCQLSDAMAGLCEKRRMSDTRTWLINCTLCRICIRENSS